MTALTCIVRVADLPCPGPVTLTEPAPLCDEHKIQVAAAVVPELLTSALREARAVGSRMLAPDVAHMVASVQAAGMPTTDPHGALVYFMANGGRVKIGYTKSLFNRISALSLRDDAVLLLLQGGPELERALHAKFSAYRVADSEWFELAPEIVHFIAGKGPRHRAGDAPRPSRAKSRRRKAGRRSRTYTRDESKALIRALYDDLGRRPLESEMVAALVAVKAPHTSRAHANRLRVEIEKAEPKLAGLGTDNVRAIEKTGS